MGSQLYYWLNGTFKTIGLNNDSRILEVTVPSYNDYTNRLENIGGVVYHPSWWLRGAYLSFGGNNYVRCVNSNVGVDISEPGEKRGVRPAFYLKADSLANDTITFNASGDLTTVNIDCSTLKEGGLTNKKYQWSTDINKPSANWVSFTGNNVTATQSLAATW